jgi:hypothetical protein
MARLELYFMLDHLLSTGDEGITSKFLMSNINLFYMEPTALELKSVHSSIYGHL